MKRTAQLKKVNVIRRGTPFCAMIAPEVENDSETQLQVAGRDSESAASCFVGDGCGRSPEHVQPGLRHSYRGSSEAHRQLTGRSGRAVKSPAVAGVRPELTAKLEVGSFCPSGEAPHLIKLRLYLMSTWNFPNRLIGLYLDGGWPTVGALRATFSDYSYTFNQEKRRVMNRVRDAWFWCVLVVLAVVCLPQIWRDAVDALEADEAAERGHA